MSLLNYFISGDMEGDEAVELQWKLEMLNSMLDQEARAEQSRRQQQYYIQCECEYISHFREEAS